MKRHSVARGLLGIFLIWFVLDAILKSPVVPSPIQTVWTLFGLIGSGVILKHTMVSIGRLVVAVLVSFLLGLMIGMLMGQVKWVEKILAPIIYVMFPVPKAALLPLIFVLFGIGDLSKVILITAILFFQISLSVYDAVTNIDGAYFLSAKSIQLTPYQVLVHVVLPAILPAAFSALRTSVGIGLAVLFFAETYATNLGLGYFIMDQWFLLNYQSMVAGILVMGMIGYGIFRGLDYLEGYVIKWKG